MVKVDDQEFLTIFSKLESIIQKYAGDKLQIRTIKTAEVELVGPPTKISKGKELWFGSVRLGKNYVAFHLMPIYAFPDLLDGISPALKKRKQGKSCFNFTHVDEPLFHELAELTERGYDRYMKAGWIG